jgi:hypothetical protein
MEQQWKLHATLGRRAIGLAVYIVGYANRICVVLNVSTSWNQIAGVVVYLLK